MAKVQIELPADPSTLALDEHAETPAAGGPVVAGNPAHKSTPGAVPWDSEAIVGDVAVRVVRVTTGTVHLKSAFGGGRESAEPATTIWLEIDNRSKSKKINYVAWMGTISFGGGGPKMTDNFDNQYRPIEYGISKVEGASGTESIYPGKSVKDAIVFELPIESAEYLLLELPSDTLGGKGMLKFQIPKDKIEPL